MDTHILLVDNGSYKAASTLNLRNVAKNLSAHSNKIIHPVSLLHSDKIPHLKLGGTRAEIFEPYIIHKIAEGVKKFLILLLVNFSSVLEGSLIKNLKTFFETYSKSLFS